MTQPFFDTVERALFFCRCNEGLGTDVRKRIALLGFLEFPPIPLLYPFSQQSRISEEWSTYE
jgi:hypothetical protein